MPYTSPATVVTGTGIASAWGNSVKAATDFLANPPACRVYHNTTQSIPDATETTVLFNSERYDTDSMHDTATNTNRITINTAGLYLVTFLANLPALTTYSLVYSLLRVDGTTAIAYNGYSPTTFNQTPWIENTTVYKLAAGQYIEARVYQDNTANTAQNLTSGASYTPEFAATWLGLG